MSFLRFREKQIVVGAVLLAALVAISSGIVHFGNSLAHKSEIGRASCRERV